MCSGSHSRLTLRKGSRLEVGSSLAHMRGVCTSSPFWVGGGGSPTRSHSLLLSCLLAHSAASTPPRADSRLAATLACVWQTKKETAFDQKQNWGEGPGTAGRESGCAGGGKESASLYFRPAVLLTHHCQYCDLWLGSPTPVVSAVSRITFYWQQTWVQYKKTTFNLSVYAHVLVCFDP